MSISVEPKVSSSSIISKDIGIKGKKQSRHFDGFVSWLILDGLMSVAQR